MTDVAAKTASAPKWETDALERVKAGIKKYSRPLAELVVRDANEGDTRLLVTDFLCDVLGFDKYTDLTTEYNVRGEFADYGIRIDKQMTAFIEVKRVATKLSVKHLRQVEMYAVNEGVEWVVLTNGVEWNVFHLSDRVPIVIDEVLAVDLLGEAKPSQKAKQLFFLTKEALKRKRIGELWRTRVATSPKSVAKALLSPAVLEAVRKELRKSTGHRAEAHEVAALLKETCLKAECISD